MVDAAVLVVAAVASGMPDVLVAVYAVVGTVIVRPPGGERRRLDRRPSEHLPVLAGRLALAALVVAALPWAAGSQTTVVTAALASFVMIPVGRAGFRRATHALRRRGVGIEPVVIVGGGPVGEAIARVLSRRPEFGLEPIGFVDDVPRPPSGDLPVLGAPAQLPDVLREHDTRRVIVAFGGCPEHELVQILRDCAQQRPDLRLHALPRFFDLGKAAEGGSDDLWGFPLVALRRPGPSPVAQRGKRAFDVVGSLALLAVLAPVMTVIALLVRRSSPGPALFRQERVGQHGRVFELLKFRTMQPLDEKEPDWAPDRARVTSVGRFLRPTHLDELPQLFNVLRGDMSLVGPRPERPMYAAEFEQIHHGYGERHRVPVGLTGWAQVNGLWGETSIADRARFDNRYIEEWSVWREFAILVRTVPTLLGQRAEERPPSDTGSTTSSEPARPPHHRRARGEQLVHVSRSHGDGPVGPAMRGRLGT